MNSSAGPGIGDTHLRFVALSSTNRQASVVLSKTRPRHGTVISAAFQHAGLGQIGRAWHSAPGKNLLVSVILYPAIAADQQFELSMAVALAVRQTLIEILERPVMIKWPNDLYAGDAKIGGILIQNTISGRQIQHTIAGIGINVNQETFPDELPNPVSMHQISGHQYNIDDVRQRCLTWLGQMYYLMGPEGHFLHAQYAEALYRRGVPTSFVRTSDQAERWTGTIEGVDTHGKLIMTVGGRRTTFSFNEIRMIVP